MKPPFKIESFAASQRFEGSQRVIEKEPLPVQEKGPRALALEQVGGRLETVHASAGSTDWLTDGDSYNGDQAIVKNGGLKWIAYAVGGILLVASFYAVTTLVAVNSFGIGALLVFGASFFP